MCTWFLNDRSPHNAWRTRPRQGGCWAHRHQTSWPAFIVWLQMSAAIRWCANFEARHVSIQTPVKHRNCFHFFWRLCQCMSINMQMMIISRRCVCVCVCCVRTSSVFQCVYTDMHIQRFSLFARSHMQRIHPVAGIHTHIAGSKIIIHVLKLQSMLHSALHGWLHTCIAVCMRQKKELWT